MNGDVNNKRLMVDQQGKRVHVLKSDGSKEWALTIVHVIDVGGVETLRLTNRDEKAHKPDWALTQKLWDAIEPAEPNKLNCELELTIK